MHLLLLHGCTSHPVLTLGPLSERLKEAGWEVRQPALPGHGTRPEDLLKVRFQDWLLAAEEAFDRKSLGGEVRAENVQFFVERAEALGFRVVE